jgi:hypothetical protein
MRKKTLAALLFILTGLAACSGGTENCTVTGLTAGYLYSYSYLDENGHRVGGDFVATGPTQNIADVPTSAGCNISLVEIIIPEQAPEAPPTV